MSRVPLLDFVLVGPFKTGTSWMDVYLRGHPGVSLPRDVKETFFLSQDAVFDRGLDSFEKLFDPADTGRLRGEVGPSYFHAPHAPARLHALAPECRVVCSLREPAARLHSFYLHLRQRGEITASARFLDVLSERKFLLETARYGKHLVRWQERFGEERVSVLVYEDLLADRQRLIDELCNAIGVATVDADESSGRRVNESMMPTHPGVSRLGYGLARRLRGSGLHRVVNLAKRSGVRKLLVSRYAERPSLTQAEREAVYDLLQDDLHLLAEKLERPLPWTAGLS